MHDGKPPDNAQLTALSRPAPATPTDLALIPTKHEMAVLTEMANTAIQSQSSLPQGCHTAGAIMLKFLFGRELGISPMVALHEIHVIEGKASMNARTQVAMVRRRGLGDVRLKYQDDEKTIVEAWRADAPDRVFEFSFSLEDARKSDLLGKKNWRRWPRDMCLARAQTRACRALFPEVFLGIAYTAEELGAETDADGTPVKLVDSEVVSGVKRKEEAAPQPLSPEEGEAMAAEVQETVQAAATASPPPTPPTASPLDTPADREQRIKDQIKLLVRDLLKLNQQDWVQIRSRVSDAASLTAKQLSELRAHLSCLHQLRWMQQELAIPEDKWLAALARRGAKRDVDLSFADAFEFAAKISEQITPFKHEEYRRALAEQLNGHPATPEPVGNG